MLFFLADSNAVTVSVWWLVIGGFCGGLGLAMWKMVPRVIKLSLQEVVDQQLRPPIEKVERRIDSHMDQEELSFTAIAQDIGEIRAHLELRSEQLTSIVGEHERTSHRLDTVEREVDEIKKAIGPVNKRL